MRKNVKEKIENGGKAMISSKKVYRENGHKLGVYILVSGGTNEHSKKLANTTNVRVNGVSIGTYARDIIHKEISKKDFFKKKNYIVSAFKKAEKLINANS